MCHAIDLDPCDVWEESEHTARKQHVCSVCKCTINPGDRYLSHFSIFEGDSTYDKMCGQCQVDRKHFCDAHGGQLFTPGALQDMLADCITEGDEESEQLWKPMLDRINQGIRKWKATNASQGE